MKKNEVYMQIMAQKNSQTNFILECWLNPQFEAKNYFIQLLTPILRNSCWKMLLEFGTADPHGDCFISILINIFEKMQGVRRELLKWKPKFEIAGEWYHGYHISRKVVIWKILSMNQKYSSSFFFNFYFLQFIQFNIFWFIQCVKSVEIRSKFNNLKMVGSIPA